MTKISFFSWIIFSVFILLNVYKYNFCYFEIFISSINILLSFLYFYFLKNIYDNIASFIFFLYIFFSSIIYTAFKMGGEGYNFENYATLAIFSNHILFFFFVVSVFCYQFKKNRLTTNINAQINHAPYSKKYVYGVLLFAFFLSSISYLFGIGRMGFESVQLPFKMNGIIHIIRVDIYPILLLLIVIRNNRDKNLKNYLILFIIWGIVECFVMYSKSRLIYLFLPVVLYYVLNNRKIDFPLIKRLVPVLLIFFILYPIVGMMRFSHSYSLVSDFNEAKTQRDNNQPFWVAPYSRSFMQGRHYMNALPYVSDDILFDFSRSKEIISLGGSAAYTTHVISNYSLDVIHSSGTTGLIDALLLGGYGLCYFTVILLVFFASYIDSVSLRDRNKLPLRILFILILLDLIRGKTYTIFIDSLFLPFLVAKLVAIMIILKESRIVPKNV